MVDTVAPSAVTLVGAATIVEVPVVGVTKPGESVTGVTGDVTAACVASPGLVAVTRQVPTLVAVNTPNEDTEHPVAVPPGTTA
jgi:hypothetical protein